MTSTTDMELIRARWRRARGAWHLADVEDPEFGRGGLARRLDEVNVRLVLLTRDPDGAERPVDEEALSSLHSSVQEWGKAHHGTGGLWGHGTTASADGALLFDYRQSREGPWTQYLCLCPDWGLDAGMGSAVVSTGNDVRYFGLTPIVARIWSSLAVAAEQLERKVGGPIEITLAVAGVQGSHLACLAEGWAEPSSALQRPDSCRESNVLIRLERENLPNSEECAELAFAMGARLENVWGFAIRRFIARSGSREGQFDWRHVR